MNRTKVYIAIFISSILMISCFGEDDPVQPYVPGDSSRGQVSLGSRYEEQVYYSLLNEEITARNAIDEYDLVFSCIDGDFSVSTNPAHLMVAADLGRQAIDLPLSNVDKTPLLMNGDSLDFRNELYTGNSSDLLFGQWYEMDGSKVKSKYHLYIMSLGLDRRGRVIGYKRIKIDSADATAYYFRTADIDGSNIQSQKVNRRPFVNNTMFKFGSGQVEIEPASTEWDLLFTRYNDKTPDLNLDSFDYAVVGVLINKMRVEAQDVKLPFGELNASMIPDIMFTDSTNIIGYDWKTFDLDNSTYLYDDSLSYAIKMAEGFYYKFRFLSFVNEEGDRGTPIFEYVKL